MRDNREGKDRIFIQLTIQYIEPIYYIRRFGVHALPKKWLQDLVSWSYRFSEVGAALTLEAAKLRAGPQTPAVTSLFCPHCVGGQFVHIWESRVRCDPYQAPDFRASLCLQFNIQRGSNCPLRPSTAGSRMCLCDGCRENLIELVQLPTLT